MVLFVCFEAREGIGILGQGTMRWEQSPPSRSRCIPSAQAKPVGFSYFAKFQKLSLLLALYLSFLFYWFILTETKGVHLLGGGGGGKGKKKEKKCIKGNTQAKRGNQWDNLVVEAYPYWLNAVNLNLRTAAKGKPASF